MNAALAALDKRTSELADQMDKATAEMKSIIKRLGEHVKAMESDLRPFRMDLAKSYGKAYSAYIAARTEAESVMLIKQQLRTVLRPAA